MVSVFTKAEIFCSYVSVFQVFFSISVPVETKEDTVLENKELLSEQRVAAVDVPAVEQQKEETEQNHIQHTEPLQGAPLQEPAGRTETALCF